MDLNYVVAGLEFEESTVHAIETKCYRREVTDAEEKNIGLDIRCSNPEIIGDKKKGRLLVQISISIKSDDEKIPDDTFEFAIEGSFSTQASMDDATFMELLNINGGAALYSIARAKIETISGLVYVKGKILLPMINMIQYYQEREKAMRGTAEE